MYLYLWTKLFHLFLVMTWMATVFGLPVLLMHVVDRKPDKDDRNELLRLGKRIYRIGHHLFGWAVILGLVLWLYVGIGGSWLHAKLAMVVLLMAHFTVSGRWLKGAARGRTLPSARVLRWHSRLPVLLLLVILWLVLLKPF